MMAPNPGRGVFFAVLRGRLMRQEAKAGPPITRHFTFFLRHIAATPHGPI